MLKKIFGSSEYKFIKKQLANFTNELIALGTRKFSNGDLMRYRDRYKRILNARNNSNISEKEAAKLHKKLEEFRERFKHLGFIDDMDIFMPPSIPEMSSTDSTYPFERQEEQRYNLRSRRKKSDDERHDKLKEEGYRSGELEQNYEYYFIEAQLKSLISVLEAGSNFQVTEYEDNQCTLKQIGDAIARNSFSKSEDQQLLDLFNRCMSLLQRSENIREQHGKSTSSAKRSSEEPNSRQGCSAKGETKVTTFFYGRWHKPSDESTNRKTADLPQVHSSGMKTEQTERLLTSSYDSLCNPDQSIAWGMLAHEENSGEDSRKDVDSYKKSRGYKETAADLIRRTGSYNEQTPNYQEKKSFGHVGTTDSTGHNVPHSSTLLFENERKSLEERRKPETRPGDGQSKPSEKSREESYPTDRSYEWARDSRVRTTSDEADHVTIDVDEHMQRQRDTHIQFVPSREFRGRARYAQYHAEPRNYHGPHRLYPHQDTRHYSPDTSREDKSRPRTRNDTSPLKRSHPDRRGDDQIPTEDAQEAKEEEPLQILDVHQYFRDGFDLNTVDAFESNLEKIDIIEQYAKPFESKVKSFDGDLLEFFVLDEKLMQAIEKLDKIKCQDDPRANGRKREVIEYIKGLHEILDERGKNL